MSSGPTLFRSFCPEPSFGLQRLSGLLDGSSLFTHGLGCPFRGHDHGDWIATRRYAEAQLSAHFSQQISFLGGLGLNEGVNWLIKHVIQEPRPCGGRAGTSRTQGFTLDIMRKPMSSHDALFFSSPPGPHTAVGTKYGMPSSHSQFMWFFSIYSFLFLYLR